MTSGEVLALFRQEMNDTLAPYLWSDAEVYRYIDDAQRMFCRKTDGIGEATNPLITEISVTPGTTWVALHPTIKMIRSARRVDTGRPIQVVNEQDMPELGWFWNGATGVVRGLVIGEEKDKAQVYPESNETMTVKLLVYRHPLEPIESDQDFEIGEKHHLHLLHWIKSRAYLKQDSETYNKSKSEEFEGKFLKYCEESKLEDRKEKHKTRIVRYGGI